MSSFDDKIYIDAKIDAAKFRPKPKYCISGKPMYTKHEAQNAKNHRWETAHVRLRIYHCPECNYHHLTSKIRQKDEYN